MGKIVKFIAKGGLPGLAVRTVVGDGKKKRKLAAEAAANKIADEREAKKKEELAARKKREADRRPVYASNTSPVPVSTLLKAGGGRSGF